ncbi:MAG TPA: NAD(P)-dependent oxidoreductase [Pseudonocardiaceae bacterium]
MTEERVLITGASGGVGKFMRTRLRRPGRVLRLMDIVPPAPAEDGEAVEIVTGSINDPDTLAAAFDGVTALIHLGGQSREDTWANILSTNIDGTHNVLEAARVAGVMRVILASSNHSVGFRVVGEDGRDGLRSDSSPRPDTYYGVSKAAIEALGALYHHRFGMDVICVRIGTCFVAPWDIRGLSTWLSPDDAGRLFEACLTAPHPGYRLIWGVSDNTRRVSSLREAEELGYRSTDNAEKFAAEIIDKVGAPDGPISGFIGGKFTTIPLGVHDPL